MRVENFRFTKEPLESEVKGTHVDYKGLYRRTNQVGNKILSFSCELVEGKGAINEQRAQNSYPTCTPGTKYNV